VRLRGVMSDVLWNDWLVYSGVRLLRVVLDGGSGAGSPGVLSCYLSAFEYCGVSCSGSPTRSSTLFGYPHSQGFPESAYLALAC
jgi:hypothetical protein